MPKIKSSKSLGEQISYDLEVEHPNHQFYLANGALASNSHSVAYGITSFQCAHFLTYHPDEWVASYLDFSSTGKGKSATGEDPKDIALAEAKHLGYRLGKPDINFSENEFVIKEGKIIIPSFNGIKGVGKAALDEIQEFRPYTKLQDLVINTDGSWRHSKFNKRAFSHLIKTEGFDSMNLVGPGNTFENYKQMHTALIDNLDLLKRVSSRKKNNDVMLELTKIIEETKKTCLDDWTPEEKAGFAKELSGIEETKIEKPTGLAAEFIEKSGAISIDSFENPGEFYWGIVDSCQIKETKTGGFFLNVVFHGDMNVKRYLKVWQFDPEMDEELKPKDLVVAQFKKDQYGLSTQHRAIRKIRVLSLETNS